jgi:two-component system cell cycle sensor histidine kinase/response regulator CckA
MQIKQNANRASNLVRQLLAFSRQQTLQPRVIDIRDVLTELSHLLRRLIGASIELRINHARELGVVKVDQGQLEQVLINLAVNARDAMEDGGRLSIMTRDFTNQRPIQLISETLPEGEWVMVEVSDTGTGIEQGILDRIFEPFFSTKEVGSGTGLGLSTVYGIIRQTGGFIDVDTEIDVGTSFTLYLPKVEPEASEEKSPKAAEETARDLTGSARILIVEDEDAVRSFSARALSNKGYEVFEAVSGESALEKIDELDQPLDLVVTDVIMPEMDGMALGKKLKQSQPDLPIIYMSGYTEDRFKSDRGEEMHFLPKPFTLKQLATKVKEVLEG